MKNELKQELTRRLCACNNGGLVLVMYDIYFGFSDDVKNALVSEDREALRKGVSDVQAALDELMGALDFKYPLAGQLYPLYSETALKQQLPMTNRLRLWTMRRRSMRA